MTVHALEFDFVAGQVSCTVHGCNCEAMPRPGVVAIHQARAERDLALARVERSAPDEWKTQAWDFLVQYLRTHRVMHVDDLWAAGMPVPPEMRALGALIQRASRERLMVRTGEFRPSVRSHLSGKPLWKSLIAQDGAT